MPDTRPKREVKPVQSRQWSCSALVEGHKGLIRAKKEKDSEEDMKQKIKEQNQFFYGLCLGV